MPDPLSQAPTPPEPLPPSGPIGYLAIMLAWAVPGLGHIIIGQRKRGLICLLAIHGLFAGGMLLGGIRAISPPEQPIWTYTQFLTGWPMLVASRIERTAELESKPLMDQYFNNRPSEADNTKIPERRAYGSDFIAKHPEFSYHPKVQDVGSVYCGIAGMLNLLVMFDVLLRITGTPRETPEKKTAKKPAGEGVA